MCANCHVVTVDVQMTDLNAIKAACERLGWTFKEGQTEYAWYRRWVDDSPVPKHLFTDPAEYQKVLDMTRADRQVYMTSLLGQCSHAISVPGARYEIGLIDQGDKFVPIWDWYSPGGLYAVLGNNGGPFAQAYAIEKAKIEALGNGHCFTEQVDEQGTVTLKVQIPSY